MQVSLGSLELWRGQAEADADLKDGSRIEHVGMYIGTDQNRQHRLISSRKSLNRSTCRDNEKGKSVLDEGIYGKTFEAVRRLGALGIAGILACVTLKIICLCIPSPHYKTCKNN